jgi:hypothetical protein
VKTLDKKTISMIFILMVGMLMSLTGIVSAQLDSFNVWENISGGTLEAAWTEKTDADWSPGQLSSGGVYNCTTKGINWTTPSGVIFGDQGHRWLQTFEVKVNDSNLGIGCIYAYHNATNWDGWLYILEDKWDANAGFYLVKNTAGTVTYANATTGTTNMSNATDYSSNVEVDYLNDYCRIKSMYNGYNHSLQVKIWNPTGDEPISWLFDSHSTKIKATSSNNMTCGLLTICDDGISHRAVFRRIFFWNLSYDLYGATTKPKIVCPTYDAMSFYNFLQTFNNAPDLWNQTQLMQGFLNSWDLTSFYTNDMFITAKTNQNDTTYVFTNMLTDFIEFWEQLFPANPLPDEAPDNTLLFNLYMTPDGTNYGEADDYVLIRIDSDNNGIYNSYDYAFWGNATGFDTGHFYKGWTERTDPDQWYGLVGEAWSTSDAFGELFRDRGYHVLGVYINWDLLYNGTSHQRIGSDLCRMSISFYDKNSTNLTIGQDFNESNDRTMKSPSEMHTGGLTPTWFGYNTTTNWFYFQVDESLSGEPLSDPDDTESIYDNMDETTESLLTYVLPVIIAVAVLIVVVAMTLAMGITKETLVTIMMLGILAVILISVILNL